MRLEPDRPSGALLDQIDALRLTYGRAQAEDVLAGVLAEFGGQAPPSSPPSGPRRRCSCTWSPASTGMYRC